MLSLERKLEIFEMVGYDPHKGQMEAHASRSRVLLGAGAERSGKSLFTAGEALVTLSPQPGLWRDANVAICAQKYDQTRQEMQYLVSYLRELGMLYGRPTMPRQGKWILNTVSGGQVQTISLQDGPRELTGTGKAFDLVCLVEAGLIAYNAFLAALRRVSETKGRVVMSGTLWDDYGWYAELYQSFGGPNVFNGQAFAFPAWMNEAIYPGGRDNPEILFLKRTLPDSEFRRLVGAELVPSPAQIYTEFSHAEHVKNLELDPNGEIHVVFDPGYFPSKYAALAAQPGRDARGNETVGLVDELWANNLTHQDVIGILKQRFWWPLVTRIYGGHEIKQHPATKSAQEVWRELTGLPVTTVKKTKKTDGIMRVKTYLRDPDDEMPRLFIDPKCVGLIHELPRYKRKTNAKGDVISDAPAETADVEDDALDALRNYLVAKFGLVRKKHRQGRRGHRVPQKRG